MAYGKNSGLVFDARELGYLYDSSLNHHTLTNHGATPVRGNHGKGMHFDGVNDYIDCGNNQNILHMSDGTIEFWICNEDPIGVPRYPGVLDNYKLGGAEDAYLVGYYTSNGQILIRLREGGVGAYHVQSSTSLGQNEWHHIVFIFGSGGMEIFFDSISEDTDTYTGGINSSVDLMLGSSNRGYGFNAFFNGILGSVKLYNRALSAAEISANYKSHGFYGSKMQSPKSLV